MQLYVVYDINKHGRIANLIKIKNKENCWFIQISEKFTVITWTILKVFWL